jgi:hypothetical protein
MPAPPRTASRLHELLPAVDVERRTGHGRVDHEVDREGGDVTGTDDAADRKRLAKVLAARLELVAEESCRERRVDEAGRDEVHAHRRELDREIPRERRQRRSHRRDERACGGTASAGSADEQHGAARPHRAGGEPADAHRRPEVRLRVLVRVLEVELRERRVVRPTTRDEHVVDRTRKLAEEPLESRGVRRVEGRDARSDREAGPLQPVGVAAGDDHVGAFGTSATRGLVADAGAAADHDDRLPVELRPPPRARGHLGVDRHVGRSAPASSAADALVVLFEPPSSIAPPASVRVRRSRVGRPIAPGEPPGAIPGRLIERLHCRRVRQV